MITGDSIIAKRRRLVRLVESPYFGRIDFSENGKNDSKIYIGVHSYYDEEQEEFLVHDWRAPVSGMFYDFELGEAYYEAPEGTISGEVKRKMQYRIRHSKLEFMFESSLNISDEVLQKELSSTSDEKMKNIVATIQRDQNRIIRDDSSYNLIIQGVAGSGKTSIALHRIAYLLYKHKDTISSKNILIISPNRAFADYVSNVLPELGEEKILEIDFEKIALNELTRKIPFQTFFEQVSALIEASDHKYIQRIRFKASYEFLQKIKSFIATFESDYFTPEDITVGENAPVLPAEFIRRRYNTYYGIAVTRRFALIAKMPQKRYILTTGLL